MEGKAMSKHTKGPWFVQGARMKVEGQSAHAVSRYDDEKKRDEQICAVWYDPNTHFGFADARLISAAPDLLEALKALYAATPDNEGGELGRACMISRAAISKAEGRAS